MFWDIGVRHNSSSSSMDDDSTLVVIWATLRKSCILITRLILILLGDFGLVGDFVVEEEEGEGEGEEAEAEAEEELADAGCIRVFTNVLNCPRLVVNRLVGFGAGDAGCAGDNGGLANISSESRSVYCLTVSSVPPSPSRTR